jgi:type IV pilus assembly protein PilM
VALFSNKSEGMMGIDISSTGIKLVELSLSHSNYELKSMALVPLPRDTVVENTIVDSGAVSQALLEAVRTARPSTRNVALAVSGNAVIVKTVSMPVTTEFELEARIKYEADEHIPYDIDDVFLDFFIQGPSVDDPEQMDVVLVACKREVVEDYQRVLGEADLNVKCIDCAVFALENAAELLEGNGIPLDTEQMQPDEYAEAHALINIGANMMNINVSIHGQMAFVRDQFYGGKNLTDEIQKEHGISYHGAEQMKLEHFSDIHPDALERFYAGLTSELVRSLDYYSANHADFPVRKLLLTGGCALIPDIAKELDQRLGIDTSILNPFSVIEASSRKFDRDYLNRIGPMMMMPIGLAMRSFDS